MAKVNDSALDGLFFYLEQVSVGELTDEQLSELKQKLSSMLSSIQDMLSLESS